LIKILIITTLVLSIGMLGMFLNILVRKNGKFPAYRVGHNKDMKKLGITCVKHEEIKCHKKNIREGNCSGCDGIIKAAS
jgi:hypothetical protein